MHLGLRKYKVALNQYVEEAGGGPLGEAESVLHKLRCPRPAETSRQLDTGWSSGQKSGGQGNLGDMQVVLSQEMR